MFQALDLGVKTFGQGVGDPVSEIGKEIFQMSFEHPGDLFDRSQATPGRPAVPAVKEPLGLCGGKTAPEFSEKFFELPGSGDLASTGT
jgi:hypothetical protein